MKKRLLALSMALCMMLSMAPAAFAEEGDAPETCSELAGCVDGNHDEQCPLYEKPTGIEVEEPEEDEPAPQNEGEAEEPQVEETEPKGTKDNPYTLEEFNALENSVTGEIYVTLGNVDMNGRKYTIGNENLADQYAGELMDKHGTCSYSENETGKFTVTNESIIIPDEKFLENTKQDNNGVVSSVDYGGIGYYTAEQPKKDHLDLYIIDGTISSGVEKSKGDAVNDTSIPIIEVLVQDDADVIFEDVTINGCYSLTFGYRQAKGMNYGHKLLHTLNSATFNDCTFNGVLLSGGGICSDGVNVRELTYQDCEFTDYDNGNDSNPIWIQHTRVLESVKMEGCTVTSTRPIKFEVTSNSMPKDVNISFDIENNTFNMLAGNSHTGDDSGNVKNAALMFSDHVINDSGSFGSITISSNKLVTGDGVHQQLLALLDASLRMTENSKLKFENNKDGEGDALSGRELVSAWKDDDKNVDTVNTLVTGETVTGYVPTTATITDSNGFTREYASLQDAIDAVEDGGTITVLDADQTAVLSTVKSFTLAGDGAASADISVSGRYKLTKDGNTYIVTKRPSSGGSSSSTTYAVSTAKAEDGKITVSPSKAEKGDTVTITVKPDAGYVLDELVITDKNGKEISYKQKSDTKFTFTMPGSKVTIEATFVPERDEDKTIILTLGSTAATVFGTPVVNDVAPIARNNRTMLPIRFIAEALGARVDWDAANQKVTIIRDTLVIEIFLNSDVAYVGGQPVQLDSPAFAENNRTYLPLRFVAENLGAAVEWDAPTQTVTITAN